jgi:hypothetical protein
LEIALENMENCSKQSPELTEEEKLWILLKWSGSVCILEKAVFKLLLETGDIELLEEFFIQNKPVEYAIEYSFQKPLKECSLIEVMDGIVFNARITNWFDTIDYTDDGDHYTLIITHSLGSGTSKPTVVSIESVFNTYGAKTEYIISERTIFMKIFKNQ